MLVLMSTSLLLVASATLAAGVNGVQNAEGVHQSMPRSKSGFLTPESNLDPLTVCQNYLMGNRKGKGLELADLSEIVVASRNKAKSNGVTHLYMKQRLDGIDIEGRTYVAAVDAKGRLVSEVDKLKRRIERHKSRRSGPSANSSVVNSEMSARQAIRRAAQHLGISGSPELVSISRSNNSMEEEKFKGPGISRDDIPVKLNYVEDDGGDLRLSWNLVIRTTDGRDWWNIFVDVESGEILKQVNWMSRDSYDVFPVPVENPTVSDRMLVSDVAHPIASPYGWHDTNMIAGAEFTDTRGNNVFAQEDNDGDDGINTDGLRPNGGAELLFSPALNLDLHPLRNQDAATLNLFYWNNVLHDVLYENGFDEASGNFQRNNYGRGGIGNDPVQVDNQDGGGLNNATFGAPPDGQEARMSVFLWTLAANPRFEILSPASIARNYPVGTGAFSGSTQGLSGTVVLGLDQINESGPTTTDGCTPYTNTGAIAGNIALVDRGTCTFLVKAANAQAAGASAVIIANNADDTLVSMTGLDKSLVIPAVFIGLSDGETLKAELANGIVANIQIGEFRDAAFDNGIIAHEYAHGLTRRLTGGAGDANCLFQEQSSGMGEGWSDWLALTMTATLTDSPIIPRAIGTYASGEPHSGAGIRNFPYTRDMGVNPLTLADIASLNRPHGVGEVWASALWDLYWNLVNAYGFDDNLYSGTGGNNVLMQIVIEGLKLQGCNPTFLEARDAIITADLIENAGANQCLIWEAFARRGMGESAFVGTASNLNATEAFDQPTMCSMQCGNGVVDIGEECDDGNNLPFDGCAGNCRTENDLITLFGEADGGQVSLLLDGVALNVTTENGQSAVAVATAISNEINSNTALQSIGGIAVTEGGKVVVTSNIEDVNVDDAGLSTEEISQQVPVSWQWHALLLVSLISLGLRAVYRRRMREIL